MVWAAPLSLAATDGIDFSFYSSCYLDVSVLHVCHVPLWIHRTSIQESRDHHLFVNSPELFADFHAFHRLLMPRHPPYALCSLTTFIQSSCILNAPPLKKRFAFETAGLPRKQGSSKCAPQRVAANTRLASEPDLTTPLE